MHAIMQTEGPRCKEEKSAGRGAKSKQGPDNMQGCCRHVPGPAKCKGAAIEMDSAFKMRCSLQQVLDATSNSVQCWTLE